MSETVTTPTLSEADIDNGEYQTVGGHYFTADGQYVPLGNRPASTTQEKVLQDHPAVVDVTICGVTTFVNVIDTDHNDEIEAILSDAVNQTLREVTVDNSYRESDYLLHFRPLAQWNTD